MRVGDLLKPKPRHSFLIIITIMWRGEERGRAASERASERAFSQFVSVSRVAAVVFVVVPSGVAVRSFVRPSVRVRPLVRPRPRPSVLSLCRSNKPLVVFRQWIRQLYDPQRRLRVHWCTLANGGLRPRPAARPRRA